MNVYMSDFISKAERIADSFERDFDDPQQMIDGIWSLKNLVAQYRADLDSDRARKELGLAEQAVREEWLKEARKAWVASLPTPTDAGLSVLARCGDYVNREDRPARSGYLYLTGNCTHKAKYATTARRYVMVGDEGPMRVYCGVHVNEIARTNVTFPRGEEGEAVYRDRIEGYDALRKAARRE